VSGPIRTLSVEDTAVMQSLALTSLADASRALTMALGCLEYSGNDRWSGAIVKLREARAALGVALAMGEEPKRDLEPELNAACGFAFAQGQGMPPWSPLVEAPR